MSSLRLKSHPSVKVDSWTLTREKAIYQDDAKKEGRTLREIMTLSSLSPQCPRQRGQWLHSNDRQQGSPPRTLLQVRSRPRAYIPTIGTARLPEHADDNQLNVIQLNEQVVLPTMEPNVGSAYGICSKKHFATLRYTPNQLHADVL